MEDLIINKTDELNALQTIDWDFAAAETDGLTHSFHPYPAKYIPQIPNLLIRELTCQSETIYDPFLGSGTTCVEANSLGRHALGNDIK